MSTPYDNFDKLCDVGYITGDGCPMEGEYNLHKYNRLQFCQYHYQQLKNHSTVYAKTHLLHQKINKNDLTNSFQLLEQYFYILYPILILMKLWDKFIKYFNDCKLDYNQLLNEYEIVNAELKEVIKKNEELSQLLDEKQLEIVKHIASNMCKHNYCHKK